MTSIAEAAAAALESKRLADQAFADQYRDTLIAICRAALTALTADAVDSSSLSVEYVDTDADMVILSDSDICLAVYEDGSMVPVAIIDGEWSATGPEVTNLADLGAALEALPPTLPAPPGEPMTDAEWDAQTPSDEENDPALSDDETNPETEV